MDLSHKLGSFALQKLVLIAKQTSTQANCARAKVGCVITDENGMVISTGYNIGFCSGKELCLAYDGFVSCNTTHAEQVAINNIPKGRLYDIYFAVVTKQPCDKCSKALINAGIKFIIYIGDNNERQNG